MKKAFFLSAFCLLFLLSCEKSKQCYECTATVYDYDSSTASSSTEVCDKTKEEIALYEKSGTIITKTSRGTTSVVTRCRLK